MSLNSEQEICVNSHNGVFVVAASPGSGKTFTLIQRYFSMLSAGIKSSDVLNLTFTASAAKEMSDRAGVLKGDSVFKTFHSFAMEILKKERQHLPFDLCSTVIPVAMEDYKLLFELVKTYPAIKNFRELKEKISSWKKRNISPEEAIEQAVGNEYFAARAYGDYEVKCREEGWLDFDDVMVEVVNLLETNEDVRNRWKKKYISVDEFQDTDFVMVKFLQLLFDGNIFCVGDSNQNLYTWRGSSSTNLTDFTTLFPGAETLFLGQNFRSSQKLVSYFKEILPVDNGIASHMFTTNPEGTEPTFTRYFDQDTEAEQTLAQVDDPENTAIIARTNRQLFVFQKICITRKIKYKILGKKDLFEQNEVKRLLKLAKEANDFRSADQVLSSLISQHNLLSLYRNSGNPLESDPAENLNSLVKMSIGKGNIHEFLEYLRRLTRARKSSKGLTLSTGHQSKGLQWKKVYVVGVNQGTLPHQNGEIQEEARLFYVSCTRAAEELHISFFKQPSQFILDYQDQFEVYTPNMAEA